MSDLSNRPHSNLILPLFITSTPWVPARTCQRQCQGQWVRRTRASWPGDDSRDGQADLQQDTQHLVGGAPNLRGHRSRGLRRGEGQWRIWEQGCKQRHQHTHGPQGQRVPGVSEGLQEGPCG